jgi:hypothetical protein
MRLAAVVEVVGVIRGSKGQLWSATSEAGPGLTRQALYDYLGSKAEGAAISLGRRISLGDHAVPAKVFRKEFRPPQSFRFLTEAEKKLLGEWMQR